MDSGILYIEGGNDTIEALDANDGTLLWRMSGWEAGGHLFRLFAVTDGLAYLTGDDGTLEAVDGRSGSVFWQHVLKLNLAGGYTDTPAMLQAVNGVVYLSTKNFASVFAFRERDGALLWQFNTSLDGFNQNEPKSTTFGDGMVFVSAGQTYALRMSDGKLLWSTTHTGQLLEANNVLYLNTFSPPDQSNPPGAANDVGSVFAFRTSGGKQLWRQSFTPTSPGENLETYAMYLDNQQLYLFPALDRFRGETSAFLLALRVSDGMLLWKQSLPTRKFSLTALQGALYLFTGVDRYSDPGLLEALRETDGTVLWSQSTQEEGSLVSSDAIYLGIEGNTDSPCTPRAVAQIEKRQMSDAALVWQRQLDPAPDPLQFEKNLLFILGGLLSLLGLLLFFLPLRKRPKNRWSSSSPEGRVLTPLIVSGPRLKRIGWLLLVVLGVILLLIADQLTARGTY